MAASVAALDLPDTVVELDLLDGDDASVEGHVAYVVDGEVLGAGSSGQGGGCRKGEKNDPQESMVHPFKIGDDRRLARAYIGGRIMPSPVSGRG